MRAACTASTTVKLLTSSTPVLMPPIATLRCWLPCANSVGYRKRYAVYARIVPPKNMTSVARNTHMPSSLASRCCSASSNWCATCAAAGSATDDLRPGVVVRRARDDGRPLEVVAPRRRRRLPFEAGRAPRVRRRRLAVAQRPQEIRHREQVAEPEDRRAGRREHVQHLELVGILPVAARHPEVAEHELREE